MAGPVQLTAFNMMIFGASEKDKTSSCLPKDSYQIVERQKPTTNALKKGVFFMFFRLVFGPRFASFQHSIILYQPKATP